MLNFSFIQITDHHLTAADSEFLHGYSTRYALRTVLQHIANNVRGSADFIISTGDIVENPTEAAYRSVLQLLNAQNTSRPAHHSNLRSELIGL
jgi:3',5'-cyclic AMP phosphodiesterase CpdA